MKFKEIYLEFNKIYLEINSLAGEIVRKIEPNDVTDALTIQKIKNKSKMNLYPKDDFLKAKDLFSKYNIDISKLTKLINKYKKLEIKLRDFDKKFKDIGIEKFDLGPFSIVGEIKEIPDGITISIDKNNLKVCENDWGEILPELTKKINSLEK